ncbi:MAG TPA: hypothetical protein V6C72_11560, partial [Chroococcales cyanobacterium]
MSTTTSGCAAERDYFGIYTSCLDGSNCRLITADPDRELNHARLSPDKRLITFTRYNRRGLNGKAMEDNSYAETEIMLMHADGEDLKAIVPARKDIASANSQFTPDGRAIIFASTEQPAAGEHQGRICRYELGTGKLSVIDPLPNIKDCLNIADPHAVGDLIVFTALIRTANGPLSQLWTMHLDGSRARRLTDPEESLKTVGKAEPPPGDYDPKLSPDGTRVACMRHVSPVNFDVIIVDVASGKEIDLSAGKRGPQAADAVPEWSADGKLLLFWHVDRQNPHDCGLWTMNL